VFIIYLFSNYYSYAGSGVRLTKFVGFSVKREIKIVLVDNTFVTYFHYFSLRHKPLKFVNQREMFLEVLLQEINVDVKSTTSDPGITSPYFTVE